MDTFSKSKRSQIMAKVRSRGNRSTEARLRSALVRAGIKSWKLNAKNLPGSPDIAFPSKRAVVFVDGCFWHGCPRCYRRPKSSRSYWDKKVQGNIERDRKNFLMLKRMGWRRIRIWEHQLKNNVDRCVKRIESLIC